jgi:hypothetical protein
MKLLRWGYLPLAMVVLTVAGCRETNAPPPVAGKPTAKIVSFTISADQVDPGQQVTLSWQVELAQKLSLRTLAGDEISIPSGSESQGSVSVSVNEDQGFVLTAWGEGGSDRAATSVVVRKVSPTLLFAAVPTEIAAGGSAALLWNVPGETLIVLKAGEVELLQTAQTSGSLTVNPSSPAPRRRR